MHSTNSENIGLLKPVLQSEDDHHQCVNNLKRKSYYELTAIVDEPSSKMFKRSYDDHIINSNNHHINNDENVGICGNNTDSSSVIIDTTTTTNNDEQEHMEFIDKYIVDHSNGTVELVNIMFDNNHLMPSVVQHNTQSTVMSTDGNYINYTTDVGTDTTSWTNVELLDLDQRGYYYSAIETASEECLVSQEKQSSEVTTTVPSSQEDTDDKNLSWLFNYKLDELPHLSPEVNRHTAITVNSSPTSTTLTTAKKISNNSRTETGLRVDELIQEATASEVEECDNGIGAENFPPENTQKLPKKPPFTYTELIEYALEDKGELTVSGIYQWISDRFPFYKSNDDRWKNSVRHNLSINPHFRKGSKAAQGAGHLWTISTRDSESNIIAWEHKKQRFDLFFKLEKINSPIRQDSPLSIYDEAAIAASNLEMIDKQQQQQQRSNSPEVPQTNLYKEKAHHLSNPYQQLDSIDSDDLKRSAEEILNGVRRTVEVQVINQPICHYQNSNMILESDYLNPVSKEQIVRESGLRSDTTRIELHTNNHCTITSDLNHHNTNCNGGNNGSNTNDYYVTEIDPIELGVNMNGNGDEEILFGDDFNLNYFGIVSGSNILA